LAGFDNVAVAYFLGHPVGLKPTQAHIMQGSTSISKTFWSD